MLVVNLVAGDPLSGEHLHCFLHFHMRQELVLPDPHLYAKNQIGYSEHLQNTNCKPNCLDRTALSKEELAKVYLKVMLIGSEFLAMP